jgi:hypothetical protein
VGPDDAEGATEKAREVRSSLRAVGADVEVANLHHPRHVPIHGEDRPRRRRVVIDRRSARGEPWRKEEKEQEQRERHQETELGGNRCAGRERGISGEAAVPVPLSVPRKKSAPGVQGTETDLGS